MFGESGMVMGVIADALASLEEDITSAIDTAIRQDGEQIILLVSLRSLSDKFLAELKALLSQNGRFMTINEVELYFTIICLFQTMKIVGSFFKQ